MNKRRLTAHLLTNILIFSLVIFTAVGIVVTLTAQRNISALMTEKIEDTLKILESETEHFLEHPIEEMETVDRMIKEGHSNEEINLMFEHFAYLYHINRLDENGEVIATYPELDIFQGLDLSQNRVYLDAKGSSKKILFGQMVRDTYIDSVTMSISMQTKDGYLIGYLNLTRFQNLIQNIALSEGELALLDSKGTYIGHTNMEKVKTSAFDPNVYAVRSGEIPPFSVVDYDGERRIIHYKILEDNGWMLMYYHNSDVFTRTILESIIPNIVLFIVIIPFFIIALFRIFKDVDLSMDSLDEATALVAEGQYDLEDKRFKYDEFDKLYQRVKYMSQKVEAREEEVIALNNELENNYYTTIVLMAKAIDAKDSYTGNHSVRVRDFAMMLGEEMDLNMVELRELRFGSTLHDIGKISISEEVLNKPGKLTRDEFETIKTHSQVGYDIVKELPGMRLAKQIILHHHERYDGSGYPYGLRGTEIPLLARIVTIADSFDAMTSERPYRHGHLSKKEAFNELRKYAGVQFDPELVEKFIVKVKHSG